MGRRRRARPDPDLAPWLRTLIPVATAVALYGLAALRRPGLLPRRGLAIGAVAAVIAVGAGPASYSLATSGRALNGNNVTAGPASTVSGPGGFGGAQSSSSTALTQYLVAHQGSAKYLVAVSGSQSAAPIILATGKPVVTIGGFTGSDNAPTVSQLAAMVQSGRLKYVLIGGGGGPGAEQAFIGDHRVGPSPRHGRQRRERRQRHPLPRHGMKGTTMKRTLATGIVAALIALGGGAFVAGASNHASFAASSGQSGPAAASEADRRRAGSSRRGRTTDLRPASRAAVPGLHCLRDALSHPTRPPTVE